MQYAPATMDSRFRGNDIDGAGMTEMVNPIFMILFIYVTLKYALWVQCLPVRFCTQTGIKPLPIH